jgi:HJR/Mrr/RecB family endonuclease
MNFDSLNGYEFEELILNLLKKMGFNVEQTPLSGDGGVDIRDLLIMKVLIMINIIT